MKIFYSILFILPLICGCTSKMIKGKVVDLFGDPVDGVEISIDNSAYKTLTDANGQYELDYAPSNTIKIIFQKPIDNKYIYEKQKRSISITEKSEYLMEDITFVKFPATLEDVFILKDKEFTRLPIALFEKGRFVNGSFVKVSKEAVFGHTKMLNMQDRNFLLRIMALESDGVTLAKKRGDYVTCVPDVVVDGGIFSTYMMPRSVTLKSGDRFIFGIYGEGTFSYGRFENCGFAFEIE